MSITHAWEYITCLIVTSTEDKFGIRIQVEDPLHNFALIHSDRSDFEILLADHHYSEPRTNISRVFIKKWGKTMGTFYGSFTRQIILEQILALAALELTKRECGI